MKEINKFDIKAKGWDKSKRRIEMNKIFNEKINEKYKFSNKEIVIDYGAGTGNLGLRLAPKVKKIYFVDPSQGMLDQLLKKALQKDIKNIELVKNDHISTEQITKKIDLIVSAMALHHVNDLEKLIFETSKVLSENGKIFLFDLDEEDGSFHDGDFDGHYGISRNYLQKKLSENGFSNIEFEDIYLIKKTRDREVKEYNIFMCSAKYN